MAVQEVDRASALDALRAVAGSAVIDAADGRFEESRKVWNATVDRQPLAIVRCDSAQLVTSVIEVARSSNVELAVRGGGHSVAGFGTTDGGIVIDLSPMSEVTIDPANRRAAAGGGCTWGSLDAAAQAHGLATTGGLVSTTGIAGLTLGGGIGWLTRAFGLACDNLIAAEVVTATGEIVRASDQQNADLLWGLRGGGGNFGVVTTFEFALHPVGDLTAAMLIWPLAAAAQIASAYREWVDGLPDEFTTMLVYLTGPDLDEMPSHLRGVPAVALVGCHLGSEAEVDRDLAAMRAIPGAADMSDRIGYLDLQQMFDADLPPGRRYYFTGAFFDDLPTELIGVFERASRERPSPECEIDLHHMRGAAGRIPPDATAFANRTAKYTTNIYACWDDPADDERHRAWARGVREACAPFAAASSYVNFTTEIGSAADVRAAYGDRHQRLAELKLKWDPDNLFRLNQNIRPEQ